MSKIRANIKTEVYTDNVTLKKDGYSGVYFHNYGDGDVYVFDNILIHPDKGFEWTEDPGIVIDNDMPIAFDKKTATKFHLLVIRSYYE